MPATSPWKRPPEPLAIYRSINAQAESLIGLYKTECVRRDSPFRGVDDLELATCSWVAWFNETRLHGSIGHVPPAEHEANYYRHTDPRQQPLPGQPTRY